MTEYDDEELEHDEGQEGSKEAQRLLEPERCDLCDGGGRVLGHKCPLCSGKGRIRAASRRLRRTLDMLCSRFRLRGRRGPRRRLFGQNWEFWSVGGWPERLPGVRTFGGLLPETESPERVGEMREPEKVQEVSWPEYVAPDYLAEAAFSFSVPGGAGDMEVQMPEAEISLLAPPDRPLIVSASAVVEAAPDLTGVDVSRLAPGPGLQVAGAPEPPIVTEINYDVTGLPVEVSPGAPLEIGIAGL